MDRLSGTTAYFIKRVFIKKAEAVRKGRRDDGEHRQQKEEQRD